MENLAAPCSSASPLPHCGGSFAGSTAEPAAAAQMESGSVDAEGG